MKLTLEKFALIAEIVGGFAVVISVIYLAYEVRQNTSATRSLTHQQIFDSTLNVNQSIASDQVLADVLDRSRTNFEGLTNPEKTQLYFVFVNYFNMWDSAHSNFEADLLEPEAWNVWNRGMTMFMTEFESSRAIWKQTRHFYKEEFQRHVEHIIDSTSQTNRANKIK